MSLSTLSWVESFPAVDKACVSIKNVLSGAKYDAWYPHDGSIGINSTLPETSALKKHLEIPIVGEF